MGQQRDDVRADLIESVHMPRQEIHGREGAVGARRVADGGYRQSVISGHSFFHVPA
jgi:hypothetical protein